MYSGTRTLKMGRAPKMATTHSGCCCGVPCTSCGHVNGSLVVVLTDLTVCIDQCVGTGKVIACDDLNGSYDVPFLRVIEGTCQWFQPHTGCFITLRRYTGAGCTGSYYDSTNEIAIVVDISATVRAMLIAPQWMPIVLFTGQDALGCTLASFANLNLGCGAPDDYRVGYGGVVTIGPG